MLEDLLLGLLVGLPLLALIVWQLAVLWVKKRSADRIKAAVAVECLKALWK